MKHYIVKLTLIMGDIEKGTIQLVNAETREEAGTHALKMECHEDPDFSEFPDLQSCWDMGENIYKVYSCQQLDQNEYEVLKRYL